MFHGTVSLEIANGLRALRRRIEAANIPTSQLDKTLNLATWNIRKLGMKRRTQAENHYIAEILGPYWWDACSNMIRTGATPNRAVGKQAGLQRNG